MSPFIRSLAVRVYNLDASIDPCFVDAIPAVVFTKDFNSQENNLPRFIVAG